MELGKGKLRQTGINNLHNAVHPHHGLIWTDGRGIYLVPVQVTRDQQLDNAASLRLGEFQDVVSVHWSCSQEERGGGCFMAVVHQSNVSVWHVTGQCPPLSFKQVRKINVQPVSQGCLWNPACDVLCLLGRQQCSFYFRHTHNRGSFAFPSLENGKISCGCWSPDGRRLVLCVGSALLIYTWTDIEAKMSDFITAAWRIPGLSGDITAIVPSSDTTIVVASDVSLHRLCANNNSSNISLTLPGREANPGNAVSQQSANKAPGEDSAMLTVIRFRSGVHDPEITTTTTLPSLLSPDLLHFQGQCVVVGSNCQKDLQVFALMEGQLVHVCSMNLEKDERPKGVCGLTTPHSGDTTVGVLVLVGRQEADNTAFLPSPSSSTHPLSLTLRLFHLKPEKARQMVNGLIRSTKTSSSSSSAPSPPTSIAIPATSQTHNKAHTKTTSDSQVLTTTTTTTTTNHTTPQQQQQQQQRSEEKNKREAEEEKKENNCAVKRSVSGSNKAGVGTTATSTTSRPPSSSTLVEDITDYCSSRTTAVGVDGGGGGGGGGVRNSSRDSGSNSGGSGGCGGGDLRGRRQASTPPQELETETVEFSQSSPRFSNTGLNNKYELNWREEGSQEETSTTKQPASKPASGQARKRESIQAQRGETTVPAATKGEVSGKHTETSLKVQRGERYPPQKGETIPPVRNNKEEGSKNLRGETNIKTQRSEGTATQKGETTPPPSRQKGGGEKTTSPSSKLTNGLEKKHGHSSSSSSSDNKSATPRFFLPPQSSIDEAPGEGSVDDREKGTSLNSSLKDSPRERRSHHDGDDDGGGGGDGDGGESVCSSVTSSGDGNYDNLERQIAQQRKQINELQKRLVDLSMTVEDTACVFPMRYRPVTEPEALTIQCVVGGKRVSRKFLLDNGRLQLDPVKQAFGLLTVELILDGEPLVLGCNIDGYIPIKFSPDSKLTVTGIPLSFTSPQLRPRASSKDSV